MKPHKFDGPFCAVPTWAFDLIAVSGTPTHTQVLLALIRLTAFRGYGDLPMSKIAECAGLSVETVKRSIKWLESNQVVTSTRLPANRGKRYRVHYKKPKGGVTGDLALPQGGVTGDLVVGSPVTYPQSREQGEQTYRESIRVLGVVPSEMTNVISLGGLRPTKESKMPIIGSDPDKNDSWDNTEQLDKTKKVVSSILQHFDTVARKHRSTPVAVGERPAFRNQVRRLVKGGLSEYDICQMIETFFANPRFAKSQTPWKTFFAREVQTGLRSGVAVVVADDTMLNWIAEGMPEDSAPVVVDMSVILRHGPDIGYSYPELLASIVDMTHSDSANFSLALTSASVLIEKHAEGGESAHHLATLQKLGIVVPNDLLGERGKIRKPAPTLKQAVLNYQLMRGV